MFNSDLEELRLRYRPFLAELVPPREIERPAFDLKEFDFRYAAQSDHDYADALAGKGEWQQVTIPDYRGPVGKWSAYYRRTFAFAAPRSPDQRVFLRFQGVDYIAQVTLNNRFVGSHEGFFAPFEFDVTPYLRAETENVLLVEVQNDVPTIGAHDWGIAEDGDKLYAATGPGWDDPLTGWHHCPPGAGIYSSVFLEERASVFVHSLFVRPNIDEGNIEITNLKGELSVNVLDKILFDSGKTTIKREGLAVLTRVGDILKNVKDKKIVVEGHTDNVPIGPKLINKFASNWELSTARAISVMNYMTEQYKLNRSLMAVKGYGPYKPVATNDSAEGRAQNRRVVIVVGQPTVASSK